MVRSFSVHLAEEGFRWGRWRLHSPALMISKPALLLADRFLLGDPARFAG